MHNSLCCFFHSRTFRCYPFHGNIAHHRNTVMSCWSEHIWLPISRRTCRHIWHQEVFSRGIHIRFQATVPRLISSCPFHRIRKNNLEIFLIYNRLCCSVFSLIFVVFYKLLLLVVKSVKLNLYCYYVANICFFFYIIS